MPPLNKLLKLLSMTCDESSRFLSDQLDHELDRIDDAALRMHLLTCTGCKRTQSHFALLHHLNRRFSKGRTPARYRLSAGARQRIRRELDREENK